MTGSTVPSSRRLRLFALKRGFLTCSPINIKPKKLNRSKHYTFRKKVQCSGEENLEKWAKLWENSAVMRSAARLQQDDGLIFRITVPPSPSVGVTLHGFSHRTSLSRSCINLTCQLSLTKTYVLLWAAEERLMIYSAAKAQLSRSTCNKPSTAFSTELWIC